MQKSKTAGFLARLHCTQPIPCNPCETACPFGAITVGEDITALPRFSPKLCRGCGLCVAACPGIAITMARLTDTGENDIVVPYEFLPFPTAGQQVSVVDAEGHVLGAGRVERVWQPNRQDPTRLVQLRVDSGIAHRTVGIERRRLHDER